MSLTGKDKENIRRIVDLLKNSSRIFFITGAGISADSGLPTYRGIGGLYDNKSTDEGMPIETILGGNMMEENPALTWKYLAQMGKTCRGATYNRGYEVIAEMEQAFDCLWTLTQNIDGFHRSAGSKNVIDIHGDIHELSCMSCEYHQTVKDFSGLDIPPHCPVCGSILRPDVVLFGEMLPCEKCDLIAKVWKQSFDIIFSVGTTSVFPYISQPVILGRQSGIPTVEINPGMSEVSNIVDIKISGNAAETLDEIWTIYQRKACK